MVVDPFQQQIQTVDVRHDDQLHFWSPMFLINVLACHLIRDAGDFYALLMNFWCGTVDGKIRIRTMYPTVRVYLENAVSTSSSMKMCDDNMDILVVHWFRHWLVAAFEVVMATMKTMMMMMLIQQHFEGLHFWKNITKYKTIQILLEFRLDFLLIFFFGFINFEFRKSTFFLIFINWVIKSIDFTVLEENNK